MHREGLPETATALLAYLRQATSTPALRYAEPPQLVGEGFEARSFGFRLENAPDWASGSLILRLLRNAIDGKVLRRDRVVQNTLVELGYPAPRVLFAEADTESLGAGFFIAQRLWGEKLEQTLLVLALDLRRRILETWSETQIRLHALPSEVLARSLEAAGFSPDELSFGARLGWTEYMIAAGGLSGLEPGVAWLRAHRPAEPRRLAICHGDLRPSHILVDGKSVSGVLDWSTACIADPALDVGAALVMIATAPVPALHKPLVGPCRGELARAFVRSYSRFRPIDRAVIRYYCVYNCLHLLAWFGHLMRLNDPIFGAQFIAAIAPRAVAYIRTLTDVTVYLPAGGLRPLAARH